MKETIFRLLAFCAAYILSVFALAGLAHVTGMSLCFIAYAFASGWRLVGQYIRP